MHQRARHAEAAGRLQLSQAARKSEPQQADESMPDVGIHDRVVDDLPSLNGLLAACAHEREGGRHALTKFRVTSRMQGF